MSIHVFAGPSLTPTDRRRFGDLCWKPPAEAGDLLRLRATRGDVVCLIDGYFDHRPAIRHKELLLLLSRGVAVLGASSIGALRAAEMDGVGLIGVGAIYRAFASGRLRADDEVALVHAPAEWDWKALSLPLVDCRASLCRAVRKGVLMSREARAVLGAAKSIHYGERDWLTVLRRTSIESHRRERLRAWITRSHVSQKRLDAIACLERARRGNFRTAEPPPMVRTSLFHALARECGIPLTELY